MRASLPLKMLVLGASGLVGHRLMVYARDAYEVTATYCNSETRLAGVDLRRVDITNPVEVDSLVAEVKPDVVVNAVGMTDVDLCEELPATAFKINALGPRNVSKAVNRIGGRLLHISTDYVFGGTKGAAYTEDDRPNPINSYGRTKLQGEIEISSNCSNHLIARSSSIYGWPRALAGGQTANGRLLKFVPYVIGKLRAGEKVPVFTDQYGSPTLVDTLAETLVKLAKASTTGILNLGGRDCLSRFDFSKLIAETFGLDSSLLVPVSSTQFRQKARRPPCTCLDCSRAEDTMGYQPIGAKEGLRLLKEQESLEDGKVE